LNQQFQVSASLLDTILHPILREYALFRVGQIIHTPSRSANIQALRSAIMFSVLEGDRLSFLEVLQHYPTHEMYINRVALLNTIRTTDAFVQDRGRDLEDWLVGAQHQAAKRFCNCDT
jgi:hypothetical protein